MADARKKSAYAQKQGRARKSSGDKIDGPRTRYAPTSPLSAEHVTNPGHRLALYFARGERLERERLQRFRGDEARVYYGGKRVPGPARIFPLRVALP